MLPVLPAEFARREGLEPRHPGEDFGEESGVRGEVGKGVVVVDFGVAWEEEEMYAVGG